MAPMTRDFVKSIETFVRARRLDLITFEKSQRKEEIALGYRERFVGEEGVLFVGKAQEKARLMRTEKRKNPETGAAYPWLVQSTAMVNHYYFYCVDRDFGPFFIKMCSYFPYTGRVCLNGHEYVKRQLAREGIAFEALDNGLLSCADPKRAQQIAESLSPERIEALVRKWLDLLPRAFDAEVDRERGIAYDISILQAEVSLTQVLDRPVQGRVFFEQVIKENLDIGRPDRVALIFGRRVTKRTSGRFRTRILTAGVTPAISFDYKHTRVKQYHKEGRALRTETTFNDTRDFAIGKRLQNLPALREIGNNANRRLLDVQRISQDASIGEDAFQQINRPIKHGQQRASGLRFGDPRVQALFQVLLLFRLLPPGGFRNRDLREHLATLQGLPPDQFPAGRLTYDLRRLRLHGLVERLPHSHRYRITQLGQQAALFLTHAYRRMLVPGLTDLLSSNQPSQLRAASQRFGQTVASVWKTVRSAA
jgi:hypothetical protein